MERNYSIYTTLLNLEPLSIPPASILPVFIFGTLGYCAILIFNIIELLTIVFNHKLHKPMYILLFNMPLNDMIGATVFFPQFVSSVYTQNRTISYSACFLQALLAHVYGAGSYLILTAMAYDRYVAICFPLKYNTLMSPKNLLKIIIFMWSLDFTMIGLLLALNYRKEICSTKIVDIFCNNPCVMKLMCGDINASNYYGLFVLFFYQSLSFFVVLCTYIHILITCVSKRQADATSKALQTCGTHLVVFLSLEFFVIFTLLAHRVEEASPSLRRVLGASIMVFPPFINPIIYGLKSKEIRQTAIAFYNKKMSLRKPTTKVRQTIKHLR